jgi:hypothetical protein
MRHEERSMIEHHRSTGRRTARGAWLPLAWSGVIALAGCSSGGSVNLGSGQTADPATIDFPVFYVKRTLVFDPNDPTLLQQDDLRQLRDTVPDADEFKRDRASPGANETNITQRVTGTDRYDVRDLDVSPDGRKLVFAMRGPLAQNQQEEDPPTWNIWEYDIASDTLRRVIASDTTADEGQDVAPHYLPDGRILFSSTRQRQSKAVLLDEGKPQFEAQLERDNDEPAFVLHVMNASGGNIKQISFNQSHDLDPSILQNGRVLWSRWDAAPGGRDGMHLYTSNPDGTDMQLLYGAQSHATGTNNQIVEFVRAREMQNGGILALTRPFSGTDLGGDLVIIDTRTYVENTQPVLASAGMPGPAQKRATPNDVRTIAGPSPGGRFASAFPLWDGTNRILVSWSQCRLLDTTVTPNTIVPCTSDRLSDPNARAAAPIYSIWMFDPGQNTLQPVMQPTEGVMITEIVAAQPRSPLPAVILDKAAPLDLDSDLVDQSVGVIHIKSVYDFDGVDTTPAPFSSYRVIADPARATADQRPARFIRLEKAVSLPNDDVRDLDNAGFGITPFMREILGYAMVEPDGSVKVKVPADVAFQISILDRDGRRISPRHNAWLQVRAGEVVTCNGCHVRNAQAPTSHGRAGLYNAINTGATTAGVAFPNTLDAMSPQAGETMAETRTRLSCASSTNRCADLTPSLNVVFQDAWTDAAKAGRAADAPFSYLYADLTTAAPTSLACAQSWNGLCRITINYTQHIQPLWTTLRQTLDAMGNVVTDDTCTFCHSRVNPANNMVRVPAGQLELTAEPSDEEALQLRSYRELLFTDNEQEVIMGALQDRLVPGPIDPVTGLPTQVTVPVPPSLGAGNARGSTRFFSRFAPGGTHFGRLTPAELRLVSEWVDIGAQYFNDPFQAPIN